MVSVRGNYQEPDHEGSMCDGAIHKEGSSGKRPWSSGRTAGKRFEIIAVSRD